MVPLPNHVHLFFLPELDIVLNILLIVDIFSRGL